MSYGDGDIVMKSIVDFSIIYHGQFIPKDFPGCVIGDWQQVVSGIGETNKESLAEALNILQDSNWDVENNTKLKNIYLSLEEETAELGKYFVTSVQVR